MSARVLKELLKVKLYTRKNVGKYSTVTKNLEVKSKLSDVEIPRVPLAELVFQDVQKWGNKIALECVETKRKFTYDQLTAYTENFNRALRKKLRLQKGDVIGIVLPNVPEYPVAIFGILQAGMTVTPINPIYTEDEISRQLMNSSAKAVITLTSLAKTIEAAVAKSNKKIPIITVKTRESEPNVQGTVDFRELIETRCDVDSRPDIDPEAVAFLPYSSGTTGLPKGVMLTNLNLVANSQQGAHPDISLFEPAEGNHQDITPAVLPLFHIYGTESLIWMLRTGVKVLTMTRFTPELYTTTLVNYKPQILLAVPPIIIFMTNYPGITEKHLECVRCVTSGAAPLGALDEERFKKKANKPIDLFQGYGLSEAPVVTVTSRMTKDLAAGSVGGPIPNTTVKVVDIEDPEEVPLGPHKTGELYVKGPQVMKGYLNNPEANKTAFSNGWYKTGDMVYYDENGMFYVTDRIKELIKVKGFPVAPAELEEVIRNYPGVGDACVIGVPHEKWGEVPRAYVIPKKSGELDTKKLMEYVASKVVEFKRLEGGVAVVDSIPKTASGKLLRRELKLQYQREMKK